MNLFIYDAITDKYPRTTRKFEEKINKLGLQGKILFLKQIKNVEDVVKREIVNGVKTVIVLGNNSTANTIINILANISENIAFFIVPIGANNSIANSLGIQNEKEAPFILSARRTEKINIAKANDFYFISNCTINSDGTKLNIENKYDLYFKKNTNITLYNLLDSKLNNYSNISPQDKKISLYASSKAKDLTMVKSLKPITINNDKYQTIIDGSKELECPVNISISNVSIPFIVGKKRSF